MQGDEGKKTIHRKEFLRKSFYIPRADGAGSDDEAKTLQAGVSWAPRGAKLTSESVTYK